MYHLLDLLCILALGGWAYTVAKRKRRDEIGWAIVAAAAFYVVGMAVEKIVAPRLDASEAMQKALAYIGGGVAGVVVNVVLTLRKPLPPTDSGAAGPPAAGEAGPKPQEGKPRAEAGQSSEAPAQQMAAPKPAGPDPFALLARYWPTLLVVLLYAAPQLAGVKQWLLERGYEPPYPPYREMALPLLVGAQVWLVTRRALPCVVAACFCILYIPTINWMEWRWGRGSSYYSHGYLIPFVVVWLVWLNRARLAEVEPRGDLRGLGLGLFAAGLAIYLAGAFIRAFTVQGISLVFVLCGMVFYLYGRAISRVLLFPLLFTITMVPMAMHMVEGLTFALKAFATRASVELVKLTFSLGLHDYIVEPVGSKIVWETPAGPLDEIIVGDVCSGLRSLIALLAFGALFAYIAKLSLLRKLILFAAAVPIAILANMWRIVTLTFIACRWGSEATHGWVHDTTGYGIFAVAFVLFFSFERFLRLFERGEKGGQPPETPQAAQAAHPA